MKYTDVVTIARTAHEINRAYCATLGDLSQPLWEDAPAWQQISAIDGVQFVQSHHDATPRDAHNNWLIDKFTNGWQLGPVKDVENKLHPLLIPFDEIPLPERIKSHLFIAVVQSITAAMEVQ
jgi:hypothetical protein